MSLERKIRISNDNGNEYTVYMYSTIYNNAAVKNINIHSKIKVKLDVTNNRLLYTYKTFLAGKSRDQASKISITPCIEDITDMDLLVYSKEEIIQNKLLNSVYLRKAERHVRKQLYRKMFKISKTSVYIDYIYIKNKDYTEFGVSIQGSYKGAIIRELYNDIRLIGKRGKVVNYREGAWVRQNICAPFDDFTLGRVGYSIASKKDYWDQCTEYVTIPDEITVNNPRDKRIYVIEQLIKQGYLFKNVIEQAEKVIDAHEEIFTKYLGKHNRPSEISDDLKIKIQKEQDLLEETWKKSNQLSILKEYYCVQKMSTQ
jgi:hypothetical protein